MDLKCEAINGLISKFGYKSYLEIGLGPLQETWKYISIEDKTCVDVIKISENLPTFLGTSDEFFQSNDKMFDLIYIDGDHKSDQVRKDLKNSLMSLNDNGLIVMHDIAPASKNETDPRSSGDAYKIFMEARRNPHLQAYTYFFRNGDAIGVIWRGMNESILKNETDDYSYEYYDHNKGSILQPIDFESLVEKIKNNFGGSSKEL